MRKTKWKAVDAAKMVGMNLLSICAEKMVGMNLLLFTAECEDTVYPWLLSVLRVLMDD